jgi:hypothetical protein
VILFLVLCGKLPFDGATHDEIIRNTVQGDFKVSSTVWSKLSPDAQNLIRALLQKNPKYVFVFLLPLILSPPPPPSPGIALPLVLP